MNIFFIVHKKLFSLVIYDLLFIHISLSAFDYVLRKPLFVYFIYLFTAKKNRYKFKI